MRYSCRLTHPTQCDGLSKYARTNTAGLINQFVLTDRGANTKSLLLMDFVSERSNPVNAQ